MEAAILTLADEVWAWCATNAMFGRTVTVKLRYADFRTLTRSRSQRDSIAGHDALSRMSLDLVRSLYPLERGVRLLGVTVSGFEPAPAQQDATQATFDFAGGGPG